MLRSLISGISGLTSFQKSMDVIGNNIANVNTTGFKAGRVSFADTLSSVVASSGDGATINQIGQGVNADGIQSKWTDGGIRLTERSQDLAISGNGFFIVKDSSSDEEFATRAGEFNIDSEGYLTTTSGQRVQGRNTSGLDTIGDIRIDEEGKPDSAAADASMKNFSISRDGKINIFLSDGTTFTRGQILLQNVTSPESMKKEGNNLFSRWRNAGPLDWEAGEGVAGIGNTGSLLSERVELSNVELAQEFSNMITTQRAYQASARIISTSDEMLQELVNMKR